jgi:hypothetical protein
MVYTIFSICLYLSNDLNYQLFESFFFPKEREQYLKLEQELKKKQQGKKAVSK